MVKFVPVPELEKKTPKSPIIELEKITEKGNPKWLEIKYIEPFP